MTVQYLLDHLNHDRVSAGLIMATTLETGSALIALTNGHLKT